MFWRLRSETADSPMTNHADGRFAIHTRANGEIELRIEMDGYLMGWRIDGDNLGETQWAVEKTPHPTTWIDREEGRIDRGTYAWIEKGDDTKRIALIGESGVTVLTADRIADVAISEVRAITEAIHDAGADMRDAPQLIADGSTARRRAAARFIGLGRELDGDAFDTAVWRRAIAYLSLDEIHDQLRAYESRFDAKYPAARASVPEALPDDSAAHASIEALEILRG